MSEPLPLPLTLSSNYQQVLEQVKKAYRSLLQSTVMDISSNNPANNDIAYNDCLNLFELLNVLAIKIKEEKKKKK